MIAKIKVFFCIIFALFVLHTAEMVRAIKVTRSIVQNSIISEYIVRCITEMPYNYLFRRTRFINWESKAKIIEKNSKIRGPTEGKRVRFGLL